MTDKDKDDLKKTGLGESWRALEELLPRLDRLIEGLEIQREQSSQSIALLRGLTNDLMWSGTIQLQGSSGAWEWKGDYTVPFARVGYVDSGKFGPFLITTDATGATKGPGTFTSFGGDSGTVPLIGRHLEISSSYSGAGVPTLFLAIFTTTGSVKIN